MSVAFAAVSGVVIGFAFVAFCQWEYHPKYWSQDARIGAALGMTLCGCFGALLAIVA